MLAKRHLAGAATLAALALGLTACSSADAGSSGGAAGDTDAATATSAEDFGGMDQLVAAAEAEREGAQIGSTSWWYTVLAVALGVLIAMLLLDN